MMRALFYVAEGGRGKVPRISGGIDRTGSSGFSLVRGLVCFRGDVPLLWVLRRGLGF